MQCIIKTLYQDTVLKLCIVLYYCFRILYYNVVLLYYEIVLYHITIPITIRGGITKQWSGGIGVITILLRNTLQKLPFSYYTFTTLTIIPSQTQSISCQDDLFSSRDSVFMCWCFLLVCIVCSGLDELIRWGMGVYKGKVWYYSYRREQAVMRKVMILMHSNHNPQFHFFGGESQPFFPVL